MRGLGTVDLLIKVACLVNNIFSIKLGLGLGLRTIDKVKKVF